MTAAPADHKLLIAARKAESTIAVARPPRVTGSRTAPPGGLSELGSAVVRMSSERPRRGGSGNCSIALKSNPAVSSKVAEITQKFRF